MVRTVLVTGGVSGIGAATARLFHEDGHRVIASYCGDDELARSFSAQTGIEVRKWDVADFEACQKAIEAITATAGPVDVLVNNAGITRDCTLQKMTHEQWREVLDVNLGGVFNMSRAVITAMRTRGFGRIVNVSSVNGQMGQFGQTNYAAAKAGMIGFTKSLALESASHGVTVNAVAPGYTDTPMVRAVPATAMAGVLEKVPMHRLGTPEEIARAILFLAGDESGFITGATLSINGGLYMA
ncbi:MAG TPA: acetoacetyl-CoA reductase [Rhizomicrobium sp.]|nr:acetoacetyl-CoA reductase [Rhizomicrobium sp.]